MWGSPDRFLGNDKENSGSSRKRRVSEGPALPFPPGALPAGEGQERWGNLGALPAGGGAALGYTVMHRAHSGVQGCLSWIGPWRVHQNRRKSEVCSLQMGALRAD